MAPAKRAADDQNGSSDVEKKRKKNPRVEEAKKLIRDYGAGKRLANQDVSKRTLYLGEYRQLLGEIEDDETLKTVFETDLKYDYTADNKGKNNKRLKQFVVRMPTAFHELLSQNIEKAILLWLEAIQKKQANCSTKRCPGPQCTDGHTTAMAKRIEGYRSTSVHNSDLAECDKKDPDLSYQYEDEESEYPGLVVEVGWSQSSDKLEKKCKWYIEQSNGETRTVIGVDLYDLYRCYPKPKTRPHGLSKPEKKQAIDEDVAKMADTVKKKKALGKIYVWRAEIDNRTQQATAILDNDRPAIFRDENGKAVGEILRDENGEEVGEVAFRLSFEDFISAEVLKQIGASHNPVLNVMSKDLCDRFDRALRVQLPRDRKQEEAKDKDKEKERKKKEEKEKEHKKREEEERMRESAQGGGPRTPTAQTMTEATAPTPPTRRSLRSRFRRRILRADDVLVTA
ncbi:hypothetical protein F4801DRAFT_374391 [Xylaria longipes]|nr:hypothetical protein F4801DRAFT_374391 [Xylaria longipes]